MRNKLNLFISIFSLLTLGLIGFVVLAIFTRTEPELDADWLSPTAPVFLSDEQLTARSLTRTQIATYDPAGTRFWQRQTQMATRIATLQALEQTQMAETRQSLAASTNLGLQTVSTLTPTPANDAACGWMWATQPNPALSAEIRNQLAAHSEISEVRAESYGENCLNADGSIRYFAAMQTDFRIFARITVQSQNQATVQQHLSPLVIEILKILAQYPPESTPGPTPGMIMMQFTPYVQPAQVEYWLHVEYGQAMAALEQGLTGPALFDALGGLNQRDAIQLT